MTKLYCKNCKHSRMLSLMCHNPTIPPKKNPYTEDIEKYRWKLDFNENGECPYYKPKWWRKLLKSNQ